MSYKTQPPFLVSSIELFPIEIYQQETDKWINPHQEGYEKPMLDKKTQQSYLKNLHERLFGTASP